jgi:hypothetical protein
MPIHKITYPDLDLTSYNCPRCGVKCQQRHYIIGLDNGGLRIRPSNTPKEDDPFHMKFIPKFQEIGDVVELEKTDWDLTITICADCKLYTIWEHERMIFPFSSEELPNAEENMPDEIKIIYDEASMVYKHSPRAAAALLRLAIEALMINHLGVKKDNINNMIAELVKKGIPGHIQKGLDALRYYGNKGIHLGEVDLNDDRPKVAFLFRLINELIKELITKPKEIDDFYNELPESFRENVDKRNEKVTNS